MADELDDLLGADDFGAPPTNTQAVPATQSSFSFFKGGNDIVAPKDGEDFDWDVAAAKVREHLNDALNARNVAFLLGSGCSSHMVGSQQVGIPTMAPMAKAFLENDGSAEPAIYITIEERTALKTALGLDLATDEYKRNLERLMEVLFSLQFVLKRTTKEEMKPAITAVDSMISKVKAYVVRCCTKGQFADGNDSVTELYQEFYQKLIYRDRALPRPWIFTTNYDLFNETAMDRRGIPYCNGFSGSIERRFNPAIFRYSLAEQLDITSRKWTAVDNFVYLCKVHGSINWIEEGKTLFPIREVQADGIDAKARVLIYPTPTKQNASLGSPYADLFREFQSRIVKDQSVLFTLGYSFGDEHINNIIFQALTVPNFRLIAFLPPDSEGVPKQLLGLNDPRISIVGTKSGAEGKQAHFFETFIRDFMPESPADKIDGAVMKVLERLISNKDSDKASAIDGV